MLISNIVLGTQDDWCSTAFCVRSQLGDAVRGNARVRSEKWRCDIRDTDQAVLTFGDNVPRRVISMASSNCFWNLLRVRALLTTKDMAARTSRLSTITSSTCSARCLQTGRPSRRSWSRSSIAICTWVSSHVVLYLWRPLVDLLFVESEQLQQWNWQHWCDMQLTAQWKSIPGQPGPQKWYQNLLKIIQNRTPASEGQLSGRQYFCTPCRKLSKHAEASLFAVGDISVFVVS